MARLTLPAHTRCNAGPELAGNKRVARRPVNPMHLVDTTLFYSPTSGGVKRYLDAKHAWLSTHTAWEHTIVVPGPEDDNGVLPSGVGGEPRMLGVQIAFDAAAGGRIEQGR